MAIDERSERNIKTLNARLQPLATALIETAVAQGINCKVIAGLRTYAEQNKLYAQGRTSPGRVVTKAKGGQSWHNFGLALDVGIFSPDSKIYYGESTAYKTVGRIGESLGFEWGGAWTGFKDEPHLQMVPKGLTLAEADKRFRAGQDLWA